MSSDRLPWPILGLALAVILGFSQCAGPASAQSDEILVARVCLSEGPADCTAICHVLAERATLRGVSLRSMARAYSPRSTGRAPYHARPWLPLAHPDHRAPLGWPGVSSWERTRTMLASLAVVAWRGLRGLDPTPCVGAIHWASPHCRSCRERMRGAGLRRVRCVSSNAFYGVI